MKAFDIQTTIITTIIAENEAEALSLVQCPREISVLELKDEKYEIVGQRDLARSEKIVKDEIVIELNKIVQQDIGVDKCFDMSTPVSQIAVDPLDIVQIILGIEDIYEICVPPKMDALFSTMTFGDIVDYIYGNL